MPNEGNRRQNRTPRQKTPSATFCVLGVRWITRAAKQERKQNCVLGYFLVSCIRPTDAPWLSLSLCVSVYEDVWLCQSVSVDAKDMWERVLQVFLCSRWCVPFILRLNVQRLFERARSLYHAHVHVHVCYICICIRVDGWTEVYMCYTLHKDDGDDVVRANRETHALTSAEFSSLSIARYSAQPQANGFRIYVYYLDVHICIHT